MLIDFKQIPIFWYGGIKQGRKENITKMFSRLGLNATHVEPVLSNSIRIGCSASHLKVLQIALEIDGPVLILEDDVCETQWYNSTYEIPDDSDSFYFGTCHNGIHHNWKNMGADGGCCSDPIMLEKYEKYYRIHGMLTTHAILYCSKKYKKDCYDLLKQNDGKRYLDVLFASKMNRYRVYAPKQPLFFQDCKNDNLDAYEKTKKPLKDLFEK